MKKNLGKKLTALAMTAVMALAMGACATSSSNNGDAVSANDNEGAEVFKVGIIQLLEHVALDAATQGFQDRLVELLGDQVVFDYQNAQGEQTNCTTIATKFVSNDVDLIMANATPALQAVAAATANIPIIGTSVTDYITSGVIDDNNAPGRNVTGVSDLAPVDEQIEILKEIVPDVKKVGILYCSAEPNSIFQSQLAQQYLTEAGIDFAEYTAADSNEIQAVVTKAISECDVLYIPTDNTMANNMEIIKNTTLPAGIPVVCGEEGMCSIGGAATLSISYYELGRQAGDMAYEILVNGANPAEMPIEYASSNITAKYNPEICEALGLVIPDDYEAVG